MLGIIIGVWAVVTMISIGEGAKMKVTKGIQSMGTNLLIVIAGAEQRGPVRGGWGSAQTLTLDDAEAIAKYCSNILKISPEITRLAQVKYRNQNINTSIVGTTPEYADVHNFQIEEGQFFTQKDVKSMQKVCIIGKTVAKELFGIDNSPIDKIIRIRSASFKVIGLLKEKGQTGFMDADDQVVIPITTAQRKLFGVNYIRTVAVQTTDVNTMKETSDEITALLSKRHRIGAGERPDFRIQNMAEILATFQETMKTFTMLLAGIAGVSLLVGGIGIMNIMLVSVTERTREIGIRKAVGAKKIDILKQFLIESVVLSLTGGVIGILFGITTAKLIAYYSNWSTIISIQSILLSFGFATAVGIFFGIYPANKAAQLDTIRALRYE